MIDKQLTYWVALAQMPQIWTRRKNDIYVECYLHEPRISIVELFENSSLWPEIGLSSDEMELFAQTKNELPNISFEVEDFLNQGYNVIPLDAPTYPQLLKKHLGKTAPSVIWCKGNTTLLQEPSVAIVGSRSASDISLSFAANMAQKAAKENRVVVSGFAHGIDQEALNAALEAGGKSIIVLPQGIGTFAKGFKDYYKPIMQGRLLVISTFAPKAPWSVAFAMSRNQTIYALAKSIYVAQSNDKGGTWSGVIEGLRKNREIYVRYPQKDEQVANLQLIQRGAVAIDMEGKTLQLSEEERMTQIGRAHV